LKLLFYSTAPWVGTGYGVLAKALVDRMIADGHQVLIGTKHHVGGTLILGNTTVFDGTEIGLVNKIIEEEGYDYLISAMDDWVMSEPFKKWVSTVFIDTEIINPKMISILKNTIHQVAVTKHAVSELKRTGFDPIYCPLGVDTKIFHPDSALREKFRLKKGWRSDQFVIGLVGINYGTDRKNILGTIRAFQDFHFRHPNSILYLHTDILGSATAGLPLGFVMNSAGFEATGAGPIQYVDQKAYHLWNISNLELAGIYNALDVMCLPSQGEGFGMPWLESQACGTPVISADTTSGRELNFGDWVIPKKDDYFQFSNLITWYMRVPPSAIDEYLEKAYQEWESGKIVDLREKVAKEAVNYDWDVVYQKYWQPLLKQLDLERVQPISELPDYKNLYEKYPGKIMLSECFPVCDKLDCPKRDANKFHYLPGEGDSHKNILQISYPFVPVSDGEKLLLDKSCKLHKWVSPRFVDETNELWEILFSYPKLRKDLKLIEQKGYFKDFNLVDYKSLGWDFDKDYANALQSNFFTTFVFLPDMLAGVPKEGGKVLDVGTGDGNRVRILKSMGYNAIGTEINDKWVNGGEVVHGDIMDLPFEDNSFDLVSSVDVLEHIPDPIKGISEMFRVSKKYVVLQATPTSDASFREDPTHIVKWTADRWLRECLEFGELKKQYVGATYLLEKKRS
jgi:glycosyltransferase involved in cell wall biosynthesis